MKQYPENNNSIEIKKLSGIWTGFGNKVEIIPKNTLLTQFILRQVSIMSADTVGEYEIKIFYGDIGNEKEITNLSFSITDKKDATVLQNGDKIVHPGERISAAISGSMNNESSIRIVLGYGPVYREV